MRKREKNIFIPNSEQLKLLPDITGNKINGLGEKQERKPRKIYWAPPDTIAHGKLQQWFYTQNNSPESKLAREKSYELSAVPLKSVADEKNDRTSEEWTRLIKAKINKVGGGQSGITQLRQEWVFEGQEVSYSWIIIVAIPMDYEPLSKAPSVTTSVEVLDKYGRGTQVGHEVASWLREQGWDAYFHCGHSSGPVLLIPHAIAAGIGELGKHGSLIHRSYGSSFRLVCIMTDVPLIPDKEADFGAEDFCMQCQACTKACPPEAIAADKQWVRGDHKWYVDFDKCILYFNENMSCAICLAVCPWSRPGIAPRLAVKMIKRRQKKSSSVK